MNKQLPGLMNVENVLGAQLNINVLHNVLSFLNISKREIQAEGRVKQIRVLVNNI